MRAMHWIGLGFAALAAAVVVVEMMPAAVQAPETASPREAPPMPAAPAPPTRQDLTPRPDLAAPAAMPAPAPRSESDPDAPRGSSNYPQHSARRAGH